jgi:anti-sigma B factor antagonist
MSEWSMTCESDSSGTHHVVSLAGELDVATVPALRAFLLSLHGDVDVDCAGLTFIDSAGIGVFAAYHKALRDSGRQLRLRNVNHGCYRILEMAGLTGLLDIQQSA